jgi:lipoprotein LprG
MRIACVTIRTIDGILLRSKRLEGQDMIRFSSHRLLLLLTVTVMIALGACANGDNGDDADAEEILDNAAERFKETSSAHFELEIDGTIGIDEQGMLQLGGVTGEIERPANARADASVVFGGSTVSLEMIASDGDMFMRNLLTGDWERAPSDLAYDPARIFDEDEGISAIIEQLQGVEIEGEESVDGTNAWHLSGEVDTDAVRQLAGDFFEGDQLDVDIWVATDDYRLLRVELHDTDADEPMSWELSLTNHDEPVEIDPPELD